MAGQTIRPSRDEPMAPVVQAYQWFVLFGTCALVVVAESEADATILARAKTAAGQHQSITVRRLFERDQERIAMWNEVPT